MHFLEKTYVCVCIYIYIYIYIYYLGKIMIVHTDLVIFKNEVIRNKKPITGCLI